MIRGMLCAGLAQIAFVDACNGCAKVHILLTEYPCDLAQWMTTILAERRTSSSGYENQTMAEHEQYRGSGSRSLCGPQIQITDPGLTRHRIGETEISFGRLAFDYYRDCRSCGSLLGFRDYRQLWTLEAA